MACYRLNFVDGFTGYVDLSREFDAEDDAAAIAIAEEWHGVSAMELWCEQRKVRGWDDLRYLVSAFQ